MSLRQKNIKLDKLISTLFLTTLFTFTILAQNPSNDDISSSMKEWTFFSGGNPIDGFSRTAFRMCNEQKSEVMFMLSVENKAESIKINNSSISDEDNRDDVLVDMKTTGSFENLDEILMYFDNEKTYYNVKFLSYNANGLLWWNATINKEEGFISRFNFIEKLKTKSKVFFRFKYLDGKQINSSFTLNGSAGAISKVVDLTNIKNEGSEMDMVAGMLKLNSFLESELMQKRLADYGFSYEDLQRDLLSYMFEKLGKYCLAFTQRFVYNYDGDCGLIKVYDLNDKVLLNYTWCPR